MNLVLGILVAFMFVGLIMVAFRLKNNINKSKNESDDSKYNITSVMEELKIFLADSKFNGKIESNTTLVKFIKLSFEDGLLLPSLTYFVELMGRRYNNVSQIWYNDKLEIKIIVNEGLNSIIVKYNDVIVDLTAEESDDIFNMCNYYQQNTIDFIENLRAVNELEEESKEKLIQNEIRAKVSLELFRLESNLTRN